MGTMVSTKPAPQPDPAATAKAKIDAAGPNEFVPVTREEFDALKREVDRLRSNLDSDQMARSLS